MQPCREPSGVADLPGIVEQYQESGLEGIVSVHVRTSQVPAHGPHQSPVSADQFGERTFISRDKLAQQLFIARQRLSVGEGAENGLEGTWVQGQLTVGLLK
jgi:hypothetical protein